MQYLLTEQEYNKLVPRESRDLLITKIEKLNDKIMELSGHPCGSGKINRSVSYYCDDCPIGALNLGTCVKPQNYSK